MSDIDSAVWADAMADPAFVVGMKEGRADFAAGRVSRFGEVLRNAHPTVDSPTYRALARTAPESERSETRPTPGTTPQFRSRPVVPRHPDAEPGWSLPDPEPPVIECLDGDIFPTVQGMYDHIRLVHLGIDVHDPEDDPRVADQPVEEDRP